jgi:hypothetical protein
MVDKPYSKYTILTELSAKKNAALNAEPSPNVITDAAPVVTTSEIVTGSHAGSSHQKSFAPVMPCHPADGVTEQLERGCTPSTRRRHSEQRRMSIKKFFRVTPEEDAVIAASAAAAGLEQSSYLRVQALGQSKVRKVRSVRADWDELRPYMGAINKAGNVVNQLVLMQRRRSDNNNIGDDGNIARTALVELTNAARVIALALKEL